LQQLAQVYFNVARVGAQGFFRGSLAQAAGSQVGEQLFAHTGQQPLQPSADCGLMDREDAGDLKQGLAVEVVSGEQVAVLGAQTSESPGKGLRQMVRLR